MTLEPEVKPERYREKRGWYFGLVLKMTGQDALHLIRAATAFAKKVIQGKPQQKP